MTTATAGRSWTTQALNSASSSGPIPAGPTSPFAPQDVPEVVVLAPMGGHLGIDGPRALVPDAPGIAVRAHRRIHRLPDVPLLARARLVAEHQLEAVDLLDGDADVPQVVALAR